MEEPVCLTVEDETQHESEEETLVEAGDINDIEATGMPRGL
jgi:hypothetical protein